MGIGELLILAVGLSMDAFAVAVCKGLSMKQAAFRKSLIVGLYFGVFQALMPLIGYFLGSQFAEYIESYDHWIAFGLLAFIGLKMIKESFDKACEVEQNAKITPRVMLPPAFATSIDALAVGISFAFLNVQIVPAVASIGVITLALSMLGVKIGAVFGCKYKNKAEFAGGLILILIGLNILFEHTGLRDKILESL
ncbi:MAG: manganese efflux pump MntP family protein [Oscillospiraceae bacterium]|jgi:putative Mn2+ efflux pump MntP|nr:manganese efflux pump MntP family protein [Oscillospiraceae bacterium]